jgi:hypothetical protein
VLIHPTAERLRSLGLAAMANTLVELRNNPEAAEMPHADWLGLLIDREVTARDSRRLLRWCVRAYDVCAAASASRTCTMPREERARVFGWDPFSGSHQGRNFTMSEESIAVCGIRPSDHSSHSAPSNKQTKIDFWPAILDDFAHENCFRSKGVQSINLSVCRAHLLEALIEARVGLLAYRASSAPHTAQ